MGIAKDSALSQQTPAAASNPVDSSVLLGRKAFVVTSALIIGVIAYQLGATMVAPTLPAIAKAYGEPVTQVSMVSSLFFLAGSISGVVATRWSDFIGRRRTLLIVLTIAAVGSVIAVFAPSLPVLLVARIMQGIAAGSFQITFVVLGQWLQPKTFAFVVAVLSAVNGGVAGFDGVLGGWIAGTFGFHWVFIVILCMAIIALVVIAATVPAASVDQPNGKMDWWGAALITIGLIALTQGISAGSSQGWLAPATIAWLGGFIVVAIVFYLVEKRRKTPLIEPALLGSRRVWPLLVVTILFTIAFSAVIYFTVLLFAQDPKFGYGLPASLAALMYITPAAAVAAIASPLTGWITAKLGWTTTLRIGLALSAAVIATIAIFPSQRWLVMVVLALLGITYKGMSIAPANGLAVVLAPANARGTLPGLIGAAFGIGNGLGVTSVAAAVGQHTLNGYVTALWISFGVAIAALAVSLLIPRAIATEKDAVVASPSERAGRPPAARP